MDWLARDDYSAAHRPTPCKPHSAPHHGVRAAVRLRSAQRDMRIKWSLAAALLGIIFGGAHAWLAGAN